MDKSNAKLDGQKTTPGVTRVRERKLMLQFTQPHKIWRGRIWTEIAEECFQRLVKSVTQN